MLVFVQFFHQYWKRVILNLTNALIQTIWMYSIKYSFTILLRYLNDHWHKKCLCCGRCKEFWSCCVDNACCYRQQKNYFFILLKICNFSWKLLYTDHPCLNINLTFEKVFRRLGSKRFVVSTNSTLLGNVQKMILTAYNKVKSMKRNDSIIDLIRFFSSSLLI